MKIGRVCYLITMQAAGEERLQESASRVILEISQASGPRHILQTRLNGEQEASTVAGDGVLHIRPSTGIAAKLW